MVQGGCPPFGSNSDGYQTTGWFLRNIVTAQKDTVTFAYSDVSLSYTANRYSTTALETKIIYADPFCTPPSVGANCLSQIYVNTKKLDLIETSNKAKILFNYAIRSDILGDKLISGLSIYNKALGADELIRTVNMDYSYGQNKKRPFLSRVTIKGSDPNKSMAYSFLYNNINSLPDRLNTQVDYWGYYTGGTAYGTLSKITYPTGGYDTIKYQSNVLSSLVSEFSTSENVLLTGKGFSDHSPIDYRQTVTLYRSSDSMIRWAGEARWESSIQPDINIHQMLVSIKDIQSGKVYCDERVQAAQILSYTENKIDYDGISGGPTRDSVKLEILMKSCGDKLNGLFSVVSGKMVSSYVDQPFAGVRTEKVTTVPFNGASQIKKYLYYDIQKPFTSSAGSPIAKPIVIEDYYARQYCNTSPPDGDYAYVNYKLKHDKSLIGLFAYSNAPMYYQTVTVGHGENLENGGIIYDFSLSLPLPSSLTSTPMDINVGTGYVSAPFSITREQAALEKSKTYFKKNGTTIKVISKEVFEWIDTLRMHRYGLTFRMRDNRLITRNSPGFASQYDVAYYMYDASWIGKKGVTTTMYTDDNKESSVSTRMYFEKIPVNNNLSRMEKLTSKNSLVKTTFKYPNDFKGISIYDEMVNRNIVDEIIDQSASRNSVATERSTVTYGLTNGVGSIIAPKVVQSQAGTNPLEDRYIFNKYDTRGNVLERSVVNGAKEVYLWGYNGQYPIAKIVGSDHATVSLVVSQAQIDAAVGNEQALRTLLNNLRTDNRTKNALATTYTYKPLIGMTSETDPSGQIIFYTYDDFGRPKMIKDENGNVIKEFCYNYAGNPVNCQTGDAINTAAQWTATGTVRCVKNTDNSNTGYQEQEEKDMNINSVTYNQIRWVSKGENLTACPLPQNTKPYLKLMVLNSHTEIVEEEPGEQKTEETRGDIVLYVYTDATMQHPTSSYLITSINKTGEQNPILRTIEEAENYIFTDVVLSRSHYYMQNGNWVLVAPTQHTSYTLNPSDEYYIIP